MRVKMASIRSRSSVSGWRWPSAGGPARQRDVDRARGRARRLGRGDARVEARFDLLLQLVGELAEARPLVGRRGAERLQQRGDEPALAREVPIADGAELGRARGGREIALELRAEGVDAVADRHDTVQEVRGRREP